MSEPTEQEKQLANAPDQAALDRIREAARREQVRRQGTGEESVE